jgi:hypothetical protein
VDGEVLEFGVSGKLVMNVLVMYDRQTDSLWSQLLGTAIDGPLTGQDLTYLPAWQTTWGEWKTRHPETLALIKGYSGNFDPYGSYYASGSAGVIGEAHRDDRLRTKQFVIGVETGGAAMAFPFGALSTNPVVNAEVGSLPVLVVFDPENASGIAFSRSVGGQTLTFEADGSDRLVDLETQSSWERFSGTALEGALAGQQLERVKSTTSFWFGWKDFHPNTQVYGLDS